MSKIIFEKCRIKEKYQNKFTKSFNNLKTQKQSGCLWISNFGSCASTR